MGSGCGRGRRWLGAVVAAGLVVSACSGGDDEGAEDDAASPTTTEAAPQTTTIAEYVPEPIAWQPCDEGLECAEVMVPVDYADPGGTKIAVTVTRSPATGQRIGPLFVYPGGPGGSAHDTVLSMRDTFPATVAEQFDFVGVEWRGSAASNFECGAPITEVYSVDYTIDTPEDQAALIDVSQRYVDGCLAGAGEALLTHIGTDEAARDIDAVRAAMGDTQVSFLGLSYGSLLGQLYAQQFPTRVRAMIIDGIVEPGVPGLVAAAAQAAAFERTFDAFVASCDAEPGCPLAGNTRGAVDQLFAQVEAAPLPAEGGAGGGQVGPGELPLAIASHLYGEGAWPSLADGIAAGLDGDGTLLWEGLGGFTGGLDYDLYFAAFCVDQEWPETPEEVLAAGAAAAATAPHFGEALVNDYIRCALWPVEEQPLPAVTAPGTPPILVISTTGDPASPHEAGVRTADVLESGVLLTVERDGHTGIGGGIQCVIDHATHYLVNVIPPPEGTVCTPE